MGPIYNVNVPLQCRQDGIYIKTEHRWVSIALYFQRLLVVLCCGFLGTYIHTLSSQACGTHASGSYS